MILVSPFSYGVTEKPVHQNNDASAKSTAALEDLHDPTQPPASLGVKEKTETGQLVLTAIFISGNKRTAIINDKVVSVGDSIGGGRVTQIGYTSVKLLDKDKDKEMELVLSPMRIKDNQP